MASNINAFLAETNREIEKLQAKQVSEAKNIVLGAYNQIVEGSAVDTSLYKHSHLITYNSKTEKNPTTVNDNVFAENASAVNAGKFKHNDTLTIKTNSLYAPALESGHSDQQPPALYGRTERLVKRQVAKRIKIK